MNWKSPPADQSKVWLNKSLEIQILLACNWSCVSCDQFSQFSKFAWVKKGTMSLEQIAHFCAEMRAGNFYFGRIRLVGGEPTIHPRFGEIVGMLREELIDNGHVAVLEVVTNGSHPEKIKPVAHLINRVRVSDDNDKQKHHTANLIATPASLGYQGKRCNQPEHCGWSLSYYGFAPCSSAGGIMRLRDLMSEHQRTSLPQVKGTEANWPKLQNLCDQCYHALRSEDKIKSGTSDPSRNMPSEEAAVHVNKWAGGHKPDWKIYGQEANENPAHGDALRPAGAV